MINDIRPTDAPTLDERGRYNEWIERNLELSEEPFFVVVDGMMHFENGASRDTNPLGIIFEAPTNRTAKEKALHLEMFYRAALKLADYKYQDKKTWVISQCSGAAPSPSPEAIRKELSPFKAKYDEMLKKWGDAKTEAESFASAGKRNEAKIAKALEANKQRALQVIENEFS